MRCDVCGLEYGMAHNCPGPITTEGQEILDTELRPPAGAGLGYYLGQAVKIIRWDDLAIRRNAKDQRATLYAILIWLAAMLLVMAITTYPALMKVLPRENLAAMIFGAVVGLTFAMFVAAALTLFQLALCHLIAKWFFDAKGRLVEVMRPLLLGWMVNCLIVVPVAGTLLAAIGWTAVLMMVFEEVDEIGRLQAFGISAGINICFFAIQFALTPVTHHL